MKSLKIGAIAAMLMTGTAFGQSMMSYSLELQGGDSHAAAWKNPPSCVQNTLFPNTGNPNDGQTFSVGNLITWSVKVAVSGAHNATGLEVHGAANMVASLELYKDGNLTAVSANGTEGKWVSSVNNGVNGTRQTVCGQPADPIELAAFPVAWTIEGNNGRVIDRAANGGPLGGVGGTSTAYWQYPSAAGHPAASTAAPGTLVGMGAGYANYIPSGYGCAYPEDCTGGGESTPGIGVSSATACITGLGVGPVFEGQLDTTGMAAGTYVLKVVPGTGNNILSIDYTAERCFFAEAANAAFAAKVDVSQGDEITFVLEGDIPPPCTRTVVGRSVFYNGSFYGAAVATDKKALLPGQTASRGTVVNTNGQPASSNVISYTRSLNGVYIDVARTAGCAPLAGAIDPSNFEFVRLGRLLTGAPVAIAAPTITAAPHPSLADTDRITLTWANNAIPNTNWVRITAKASLGLAADDVHYWGIAIGDGMNDATNNVIVDTADQAGPRPPNNHTTFNRALITDVWDFNKDSIVDTADQATPRPPNNTTTFNCLVLGVAP